MSELDSKHNSFDDTTKDVMHRLSARLSRRSLLDRLGRATLYVLGASVVPLLPIDRVLRSANGQELVGCSDWQLCGIGGRLCNSCTCGTANNQACPACTNQGSLWTACCPVLTGTGQPTGERRTVEYIDCCGQNGDPQCTGDSNSCNSGTFCSNASVLNWCGQAGQYKCTRFRVGNQC